MTVITFKMPYQPMQTINPSVVGGQMNNNSMPNPQFNQMQSNTQNNYQMLNENQPQMNTNEFTNINENLNNNTTQNEFKVRKKYINFLFRIKYYQVD